jgi:hypothetical protein
MPLRDTAPKSLEDRVSYPLQLAQTLPHDPGCCGLAT